MGRLDVRICEARNLPDTQLVGKPDPYVIVKLEHQVHKTSVCDNNTSPKWEEVFKFTVADENSAQIRFELWNKNVVSDEFLGQYSLSLSGLTRNEVKDQWYLLQQCKSNAELRVRLMAQDFGRDPAPKAPGGQQAPPQGQAPPPAQQPGGYPPQGQAPPPQSGYPPQQQQGGYPPQQPPPQGQYPPQQQGAYPPPQGQYPPPQGQYPPPQGQYPPPQGQYPPPQGQYPPPQGQYPPPQGQYPPPQQGGYPPQQGGYPPQQGGYPPQQPGPGYPPPPQQAQGYPPQQGYGY